MSGFIFYCISLLRYRGFRDYLSMGYGIEARYARCRQYWDHHIALTKSFIQKELSHKNQKSLLIAGSGRLLDFPVETFDSIKDVVLVDADPGALEYCRRNFGNKKFTYIHKDITDAILRWELKLKSELKKRPIISDIADTIETLDVFSRSDLPKVDVVISLNMLGQIPVYWRERAKNILAEINIHTDERDEFIPIIEDALRISCAKLQSHALRVMASAARSQFILITDRYYHFYQKDISPWKTHDALYINLEEELSRFSLTHKDSWLWHIAPQDIELTEYGVIHEVYAYAFSI